MSSQSEPGSTRDRRATDGLDWVSGPSESPPSRSASEAFEPVAPAEPVPPVTHPAAIPSTSHGRLFVIALATTCAVLGGAVAGATVAYLDSGDSSTPNVAAVPSVNPATLNVQQTSIITEVAAKSRPGVVRIESTHRIQGGVEHDIGSGIVFDADGHILTNAHVVLNTDTLKVILADGTERPAILVGHDYPFTDLAVLQVGPGNLQPIQSGDSDSLKLGETVIAIGNPLAEFDGSVSVGVVSGLDRHRVLDGVQQTGLIQTDAAVNSGNSGGALLNLQGQFIGIPTVVLRDVGSGASVEGIAFALPSNRILPIARQIIADGASYPRPSLEVDARDLTPEVLSRLPRPAVSEGAIVLSVTSGGAGAVAGIQAGDIITKLATVDINTATPLLNALEQHAPGETVRVVLNRNGRIIEADVRLTKRG